MIVSYCCNTRQCKGREVCDNKEIRREYIEALILDELARNIFDDSLFPVIAEYFNEYNAQKHEHSRKALEVARKTVTRIDNDINALIELLTKISSMSLINRLDRLESEKSKAEEIVNKLQMTLPIGALDYQQIKEIFDRAKDAFSKRSLDSIKSLVNAFVDKIVLYNDRAEIKFTFKKSGPPPRRRMLSSEQETSRIFFGANNGKLAKMPLLSRFYDVSSAENTRRRGRSHITGIKV